MMQVLNDVDGSCSGEKPRISRRRREPSLKSKKLRTADRCIFNT